VWLIKAFYVIFTILSSPFHAAPWLAFAQWE
jgi:hypothetical protein